MIFPLAIGLLALVGWLACGHYYFQRPRHVLAGHEITVYGSAGILFGCAVYVADYWYFVGATVPVWQVAMIPGLFLFVGGLLTALMHGHDATLELQRQREAEYTVSEAQK